MKRFVVRRPGGKTLIVEGLKEKDGRLHLIISGDFFAYPEHLIDEFEREASDCRSVDCLERVVMKYRGECQLVGVEWDDVLECLRKILEDNGS